MELKERLLILRKRAVLIILITAALTIASGLVSFYVIDSKYNADVSVIIGNIETKNKNSGADYYNIIMYQTLVKTYCKLAESRTVAEDVAAKLQSSQVKADELLDMVEVTPDKDTQFLTISVTATEPQKAMDIANQFAKSLDDISYNIYKEDNVKLLEQAVLPKSPSSPKPVLNIGAAFFLGLLFSIGLAYFLEYMDSSIKTREDVEEIGLAVIGTVLLVKASKGDVIIC